MFSVVRDEKKNNFLCNVFFLFSPEDFGMHCYFEYTKRGSFRFSFNQNNVFYFSDGALIRFHDDRLEIRVSQKTQVPV